MKYFKLLVVSITAVLLLAACGETNNETPTAVMGPTVVTEATGEPVEEPSETMEEPTEAPMVEPTGAVGESMEEPTVEPTATIEPMTDTSSVGLELVAEGLTSPVALVPSPDDSGRLFVADLLGQINIITADGQMMAQPFLDLRSRMVQLVPSYDERGLLGMAFHPNFAENGKFYVYYSAPLRSGAPTGWDNTSHVSEFTVSADNPNVADPYSERIIMEIDEPQPNHDAGTIAFGPDGYLYIPLGDGGAADDNALGHVDDWYSVNAGGNGQDTSANLLGSVLRIDVDTQGSDGQAYAIPPDNPFIGTNVLPETWAFGFRNPYRMSFDMGGDHQLFVGDAGQNRWEEVSIVEAGGNYGWNVKEGTHCFSTDNPDADLGQCPGMDNEGRPLIDPILEYQNGNAEGGIGLVVIGGNVYRGSAMHGWDGFYIFGDWSRSFGEPDGTLFLAMPSGDGSWTMHELGVDGRDNNRLNEYLLSFGQDNNGEIYILTTDMAGPSGNTGKIYKIVPAGM
ncbi:MAG: PQQ-dependent sugar dehydrogenase [Candidatus Promineifilaceae bacterium]